jgi:quinolinate synthase
MSITVSQKRKLSDEVLINRIRELKEQYGSELVILGHHYQQKEIVYLSDYKGDSFELCQHAAAAGEAKYIVFCGVEFMAESARILARPEQIVIHPDTRAGCPMADMADKFQVEAAWKVIDEIDGAEKYMPITYMNSDAETKSFCGKNGGAVCTSSNSDKLFKWAFAQREKIIFFPDEHLGRNTANDLGIPREEQIIWDQMKELGGNTEEQIRKAKVILWKGFCHVHTWFKTEMIEEKRREYPGAVVIVHPECTEEVVAASDYSGSTKYICDFVEAAAPGSKIVIGTEINLIHRLAHENPDKTIVAISRSLCPNMFKINLKDIVEVMENMGELNVVDVSEEIIVNGRLALERMLEAGK